MPVRAAAAEEDAVKTQMVIAALLCGAWTGAASAQDSINGGATGTACAQLNGMAQAEALAFLQGYQAGRMDAAGVGTTAVGGMSGNTAAGGTVGGMEPQSIIDACKNAPDATLTDILMQAGSGGTTS